MGENTEIRNDHMAQKTTPGDTPFEVEVVSITLEMLKSGEIESIFREKIKKGFEDAISSSFSWGGELRKAIDERIKDSLVPMIQNLDMEDYLPKLDVLLSEIVRQTDLSQSARIIETFGILMNTEKKQTVPLEDLFDKYNEYVAEECDCDDLEVVFDDGPHYEYVRTHALIERSQSGYMSSFEHAVVTFYTEDQEELTVQFPISRWEKEDFWMLSPTTNRLISDLARSNQFDVLLAALAHQGAHLVIGSEELEEDVEPNKEPEPDWS